MVLARRVTALLIIVVCCAMSYLLTNFDIDRKTEMYILNNRSEMYSYDMLSDNTLTCDLASFSNMINGMEADGYRRTEVMCAVNSIDLVMTNDKESYRITYTKEDKLTSIANPYEKSYVPVTYIDEKK